jgi:hypothetical protein
MKLTIELVPSSSWYSNVRSNVSKKEWDIIRKKVYAEYDYKCSICKGKGDKHPVECHEVWEYNDDNHIQKLIGMIALCPNCHKVKHIGRAQITNEFYVALEHLSKINNITEKDAEFYIEAQFEQWARRSKHEWDIDITFLKEYLKEETW